MQTRAERLREARKDAGYTSAIAAARAHGWNHNTLISNENGNAQFSIDLAAKYAEAFAVSLFWLWSGTGPKKPDQDAEVCPIQGEVSSDGSVNIYSDNKEITEDDLVYGPSESHDKIALIARQGSISPVLKDWVVFIEAVEYEHPHSLDGSLCVVRTKDGRNILGVLESARTLGLYHVRTASGGHATDLEVQSVSPVTEIRPREAVRGS